jgi:hypothetical protein
VLVDLLSGGPDSKVACDALQAMRCLTLNNIPICSALRESGAIPVLVALLQTGPEHQAARDACATLAQMSSDNVANQNAVRESSGIRPLIAMLGGDVRSEGLAQAARCLANLSRDNRANRLAICNHLGTIERLVALLGAGGKVHGARRAADVLRSLMNGNDERIAVTVLGAMRRQGVGLGQNATFKLSDEFPKLRKSLMSVAIARLDSAVIGPPHLNDRNRIQMALNDAVALDLPEEHVKAANARLELIAATQAEALAARNARIVESKKEKEEERDKRDKDAVKTKEHARQKSAKKALSNGEEDSFTAGAVPTGTVAVLLEAQQRLREIENAAAQSRRARQEAAAVRATVNKPVNQRSQMATKKHHISAEAHVTQTHGPKATSEQDANHEHDVDVVIAGDTSAQVQA